MSFHQPHARLLLLSMSLWGCNNNEVAGPEARSHQPGPVEQAKGPNGKIIHAPPPGGMAATKGMKSGAEFQDPSGFPMFHGHSVPAGPAVPPGTAWSEPIQLTKKPTGGYRPQLVVGPDDRLHAVYYDRTDGGDIIRHRTSQGGLEWSPPAPLGHTDNRNWGPDLVARADGSVVLVYDHALEDFSSQGFITFWRDDSWSTPTPLTPGGKGEEVGSGHIAHGPEDSLVYVFIGKKMSPEHHFQAWYRMLQGGVWTKAKALTDGQDDAWHTNVERRPDGSMLAGWDVGMGGSETTLYVAEVRDGVMAQPENISATSRSGERVHFAFGADGQDHLTWFHKEHGNPIHIYTRSGKPGHWGTTHEPSAGFGGFHFDPDIAINHAGVRCLVWGWDAGDEAELVYSVDQGEGWSSPKRVANIAWGKPGLPSIDVDSSGQFHVIWNQGVRGYNEVYVAQLKVP